MQRRKLRGAKSVGAERKEMMHSGPPPKPAVIVEPTVDEIIEEVLEPAAKLVKKEAKKKAKSGRKRTI